MGAAQRSTAVLVHQLAAMALLIRSANLKSGSDWTDAELLFYNIVITLTSPDDFFHPCPSS